MVYLFALFSAPVIGMVSYYLGLIVMTKAKMKQKDNDFFTHISRIFFGLLLLSCIGIVILSLLYIVT